MTLNLNAYRMRARAEDGAPLDLRDPQSGNPTGAVIRVRGYDSDSYQRLVMEQQRRRLDRMPAHKPTPEEIDEDARELSAALVAGWDDDVFELDGAPLRYTPGNVRGLYAQEPWIRDQVEMFARERANFFPPPASGSSLTPVTSAG